MTKIPYQDPHPDPDPLVRGMDPRIQIHTKMSWIRTTAFNVSYRTLQSASRRLVSVLYLCVGQRLRVRTAIPDNVADRSGLQRFGRLRPR
jgi:hypothetical protein